MNLVTLSRQVIDSGDDLGSQVRYDHGPILAALLADDANWTLRDSADDEEGNAIESEDDVDL